jgi:hypothetical protein
MAQMAAKQFLIEASMAAGEERRPQKAPQNLLMDEER